MSPRTARTLVLDAPRRLVARDIALPETGADDALLRVEACGLCGTDHEQYTGVLFGGFAFVPGHEAVGVLERIGDTAAQRWGVAEGDRVAVAPFQACRNCPACAREDYRRCPQHGLADMAGFIPVDRPPGLWGGYSQYQYLGPDALVFRVPDGLDAPAATLFNPLGAGIRWGVTVPSTQPGDVVAILGPGIRGLCALAATRAAGASFVMVTGAGERDAARLEAARGLGADLVVDVTREDPVAALRSAGHRGAQVVVDVTAKAPSALGQAVHLARPGGAIVLAGIRGTHDTPGFDPDSIVYKELRLLGALGVDAGDYRRALDLLGGGATPIVDVSTEVVGFDDLPDLLATMAGDDDRPPPLHGVLDPWR